MIGRSALRVRAVGLVLFVAGTARAELWRETEDEQLVRRADLIVVGRLGPGSIEPMSTDADGHRARLLVDEIVKGPGVEKTVEIGIPAPLVPVSARAAKSTPRTIQNRTRLRSGAAPLVKDARRPSLWFLKWQRDTSDGRRRLSMTSWQDLQPLALERSFRTYLARDPARALRALLRREPQFGARALPYLQHIEVQRRLAVRDPARRVELLLPHWLSAALWDGKDEAGEGIVGCGRIAGPYLLGVLEQPAYARHRSRALVLLGRIRHREAVPAIVELLRRHIRHWEREMAAPEWSEEQAVQGRNIEIYAQSVSAVSALAEIGDPKGLPVVRALGARWAAPEFKTSAVVEAVQRAERAMHRTYGETRRG